MAKKKTATDSKEKDLYRPEEAVTALGYKVQTLEAQVKEIGAAIAIVTKGVADLATLFPTCCTACKGYGVVPRTLFSGEGERHTFEACKPCFGTGLARNQCSNCQGSGRSKYIHKGSTVPQEDACPVCHGTGRTKPG